MLGLFVLGKSFSLKTLISTIVYSPVFSISVRLVESGVFNNFFDISAQYGEISVLLGSVFGGAFVGVGCAIAFLGGGSTGGTDIIAWIINKYKDVTLGRLIMYMDIIIISSCYFIFHDWKRVVFGFTVLFILSIVIDYVVNSTRQSVQFLIFSRKYEEIAERINTEIKRGVTLLNGTGWYSKQDVKVIVVLAKKSQSLDIFRLVKDIDPDAFISQSNVVGVYGEGFDKLKVK